MSSKSGTWNASIHFNDPRGGVMYGLRNVGKTRYSFLTRFVLSPLFSRPTQPSRIGPEMYKWTLTAPPLSWALCNLMQAQTRVRDTYQF